ncbi:hypothetical protein E3J62_06775 [candidate division TA06 bacterium]|uniref:Uncharacterized protein n=1 Tax=candidate division TA06 bacterium TaxID=2250710 RepID=A0A523UTP9_UNCT6|nr:MAG: hypothetical protein E3J62_06775 [candidate division TA06 bacterium]
MKKFALGLAIGLPAWAVLLLLVGLFPSLENCRPVRNGIPVLLAAVVAGYIARKQGPICGVTIGMIDILFTLMVLWLIGRANIRPYPLSLFLSHLGLQSGLMLLRLTAVDVLSGVVGGYTGSVLSRSGRLRRRT